MRNQNERVQPPAIFRPFLWWAKWEDIDVRKDREDIIVSAINEGTLDHWRWILKAYGKDTIREILENRLASEFHKESKNLAQLLFSVANFRHARGSTH